MSSKLKKLIFNYIFDGILLILLGLAMIIWPDTALTILCYVTGGVLIVLGIIKGIIFFSNKGSDKVIPEILIGVTEIIFGVILIVMPWFFIEFFQIITGIVLIYGSILMFIQAYRLNAAKDKSYVVSLVLALITLVLAILILIDPQFFAQARTVIHGVSLIIEGFSMIIALRKAIKKPE